MERLRQALEAYQPDCGQELRDRELMLSALSAPHVLTRENPVEHFTASAWVIDRTGEQVLMLWHNIYRSWSWLADTPTERRTCWRWPCGRCRRRRASRPGP